MSSGSSKKIIIIILILLTASLLILRHTTSHDVVEPVRYTTGKVVDIFTKQPVKDAIVTITNNVVFTDENGAFTIKATGNKVAVRAYGYLRTEQTATTPLINTPLMINLVPFTPKALYLTFYGIGCRSLREPALKLIEETELNALVIDVKGDRGMITFKSSIPLASQIGAQKLIIVKDMGALMKSLKEKGIYTIARIVVFKDNLLGAAKPDLAVKTQVVRCGATGKISYGLTHSVKRFGIIISI